MSRTLQRITDEIEQKRAEAQAKLAKAIAARGPQVDIFSPQAAGMGSVFATAAQQSVAALTNMQKAILSIRDALGETQTPLMSAKAAFASMKQPVDDFANAMGKSIVQAIMYGQNIGKAMKQAAEATIESIADQAMVKAIFETAVGFADLFVNPPAAAAAFESAALFASIGGPGALGGGGLAPTLAGGAQAPVSSGGLTVAIMGNEEAGQWLATTLNKAVSQQGVQLVASDSQRSAKVGH